MKMRRVFVSSALLVMLGGCHEVNPDPGPPEDPGPFLSDTPLWTLDAPESLRDSCFGNSLALGDVNGDGHQDLVVAAPPCAFLPGKGHVVLYAGNGSSFSTEPVIAEMDWQKTPSSGRSLAVSIGNVNGDRFADILVRASSGGLMVFTGREELGSVFQSPLFRLPATSVYRNGFFTDLNGDGVDEVVAQQGFTAAIYRVTPGGEAPYALLRSFPEYVTRAIPAGDTNGDGLVDLMVQNQDGAQLFLGCGQDEPGLCQGGLSAAPVWRASEDVLGFFPDQNGDGRSEVLLGFQGRVQVNLFQPEGGISPTPIWSMLGDAAFPGFGAPARFVGDLDKDNKETEFLLSAAGRLYAFFPQKEVSAELRPTWAWPKSDSVGPSFHGFLRYAVVRAGDLNGDGYADIIAGLSRPYDALAPTHVTKPGQVVAFGGGKVPPQTPEPYLKAPTECGLAASSGGKPDVTVDADVISRTLYVERRNFAETACEVSERCVGAPGDRRLLRFSVSIPNLGTGAVLIESPDVRPELYEFDVCHGHHHLTGFASYELLGAENAVVAVGRKQGFALVDLTPYCADAPRPIIEADGSQRISPGWADVYAGDYSCQWLDVTEVPDGTYTLRIGVDKSNLIDEQDVLPNSVDVKVKLSGNVVEVVP
jgi:lysyl oxidase/FG-GAP repeat protein